MVDVTPELLPDYPILLLKSAVTNKRFGIVEGQVLGYYCIPCGVADENVHELIHEEDCDLAGETKPTAYADRPGGPLDVTGGARGSAATDGGQEGDER